MSILFCATKNFILFPQGTTFFTIFSKFYLTAFIVFFSLFIIVMLDFIYYCFTFFVSRSLISLYHYFFILKFSTISYLWSSKNLFQSFRHFKVLVNLLYFNTMFRFLSRQFSNFLSFVILVNIHLNFIFPNLLS